MKICARLERNWLVNKKTNVPELITLCVHSSACQTAGNSVDSISDFSV